MRKLLMAALMVGALVVGLATSASAKTTKSFLYHDGGIVRTVVNAAPPSRNEATEEHEMGVPAARPPRLRPGSMAGRRACRSHHLAYPRSPARPHSPAASRAPGSPGRRGNHGGRPGPWLLAARSRQ